MNQFLTALLTLFLVAKPATLPAVPLTSETTLASHQMSLETRYSVPSVNEVMKKNILLNLAYLNGTVKTKNEVNWMTLDQPFSFDVSLAPNQTFAYHDHVLPEYQDSVTVTTKAHFSSDEGFVSDGYLFGDGVCHLASLINWAAQDAGLTVLVTKNHNFASIPEVPKEYGVSIYTMKNDKNSGTRNNLYITNNKGVAVSFHFEYDQNHELKVSIVQSTTV